MYDQIKKSVLSLVDFSDEEWHVFQESLSVKKISKKDFYIKKGEVCKDVSFINKGAFRAYYVVGGKEITSYFSFENDYVTDYESFLLKKPSLQYIQAIEDTELLVLHYDKMQELYGTSSNAERYGRLVAESLFVMVYQEKNEFVLYNPEERYTHLLSQRPDLFQRVPQIYIASLLGITPETLSRIRKRMSVDKR